MGAVKNDVLFTRGGANPVLTPDDWPYPVGSVTNPAAALVDGQTVLLCRVEDRYGTTHLTVARSADGRTGWRIDPVPLMSGDPGDGASAFGVEDPRLTWVPEIERWIIAYTSRGPDGGCTALASTLDFTEAEPIGIAIQPDNRDGCLLPGRVDGEYALLHTPASPRTGRSDIWLSRSADLLSWAAARPLLAARNAPAWDSVRVGIGPPPLATPAGWLGIYYGVRPNMAGYLYRVGLVLLDRNEPEQVLHRSHDWILAPVTTYERCGDVPNMILPTGLVHDPGTDELRLYYGAAETVTAMASARLPDVIEYLKSCPADDPGADRLTRTMNPPETHIRHVH